MIRRIGLALAALTLVAGAALALDVNRTPLVSPESGQFSERGAQVVSAARLQVGTGTGTCVSNAVTINKASGVITTEALTTAAAATQAITLTNSKIQAGDMVIATADPNGSTGTVTVANVAVSAGSAVILLQNIHASVALNAAVKIMFFVVTKGNPN